MTNVLGITLARGGSKRLPGKNIKKLHGKPLINYTIEAAKFSVSIDRHIISTDDKKIAETAAYAGAEVPFLRPAHLAEDKSDPIDACLHVLEELEKREQFIPDIIVLLQPTSPLRTSDHIDKALGAMLQHDADAVISVTPFEHPVNALSLINLHGHLDSLANNIMLGNQPLYRINGAIYAIKYPVFMKEKAFFIRKTIPYEMSAENSVDIDTETDFDIASCLLGKRNNH
ncbi:cytidylyltransferase domain-containing protein [Thalassobacillus pellis]|uniref:acylneuraminate cytidylyltransferase family protein n=1 Tax=Thalassobacillus pellis TaxID=748008 RepID=UPI00196107BA|nr:acylneuraminate cytidylyltransferase family protein [Thalassobacillus pellis]MBM7552583.1 CMP-N-acetylneuraminic acid synthetase [Thalassobacillus pellis]